MGGNTRDASSYLAYAISWIRAALRSVSVTSTDIYLPGFALFYIGWWTGLRKQGSEKSEVCQLLASFFPFPAVYRCFCYVAMFSLQGSNIFLVLLLDFCFKTVLWCQCPETVYKIGTAVSWNFEDLRILRVSMHLGCLLGTRWVCGILAYKPEVSCLTFVSAEQGTFKGFTYVLWNSRQVRCLH